MQLSNRKKILEILNDGNWHCTNEFYGSYIADPRTIIAKMRKDGYNLQSRWCETHKHNHSKEWRLNYAEPQSERQQV